MYNCRGDRLTCASAIHAFLKNNLASLALTETGSLILNAVGVNWLLTATECTRAPAPLPPDVVFDLYDDEIETTNKKNTRHRGELYNENIFLRIGRGATNKKNTRHRGELYNENLFLRIGRGDGVVGISVVCHCGSTLVWGWPSIDGRRWTARQITSGPPYVLDKTDRLFATKLILNAVLRAQTGNGGFLIFPPWWLVLSGGKTVCDVQPKFPKANGERLLVNLTIGTKAKGR
ncbi:hypothetical protein SERLADRAFT_410010 [Serpula lacrymans var. lacrymans S7.9]|uniref:Uncharacterized protein n=1 Tax=Serpula lacrymans var. lacrymans (strain S7.9) TaxID=578457 RepID=F8P307_SERL9|nr:uncharacterized protein SERLADRAFT_410010 [Serpula lacrymans var. lacrymans S7.9]EGO22538.1 hypothetical protein SERLADRAFT_410010 [Serpula lacrymans var. lacrymans S7.9]